MKTFKTHITDTDTDTNDNNKRSPEKRKKKKRFLKKTDYADQDLDLSKLYTLDDIRKSHEPDEVYVSPDAAMIVVQKEMKMQPEEPRRVESFSHLMKTREYEANLEDQLNKIQSRIFKKLDQR